MAASRARAALFGLVLVLCAAVSLPDPHGPAGDDLAAEHVLELLQETAAAAQALPDQPDAPAFTLWPESPPSAGHLFARTPEPPLLEPPVPEPSTALEEAGSLPKTRVPAFGLFESRLRLGSSHVSREDATGYTLGLRETYVGPTQKGLWTDPVTGLAYARARWYDPRNASWLSEDPLLDVDSPNLYAFVAWQPTMATDPLGREAGWIIARQHQQLEEAGIDPYLYGRGNVHPETVARNMVSIGVSFTVVGMGYDAYSAVKGHDPILDEDLSGFDRWLTGLGMIPGIPGSKLRQGRRAIVAGGEALAEAARKRKQLNPWNEYQRLSRDVDLTPAQRATLYRQFQGELSGLGIDPSLVRVVSGDAEKVAVIGRGMTDRVEPVARNFGAETFPLSEAASREFRRLLADFDGQVPGDVIRKSLAYQENVDWVRKVKSEGYTIIDVGELPGSPPSTFYDMEVEILYGQP